MKQSFQTSIPWIGSFLTGCVVLLFASVGLQQVYRQSANDPLIQLAEDAGLALDKGGSVSTIVLPETVDTERSLAPFLIVVDDTQKVLANTGILEKTPIILPPEGVFPAAQVGGHRFTWQPTPLLRFAAVVVSYHGKANGYVVAARSLREVEHHENELISVSIISALMLAVLNFLGYHIHRLARAKTNG